MKDSDKVYTKAAKAERKLILEGLQKVEDAFNNKNLTHKERHLILENFLKNEFPKFVLEKKYLMNLLAKFIIKKIMKKDLGDATADFEKVCFTSIIPDDRKALLIELQHSYSNLLLNNSNFTILLPDLPGLYKVANLPNEEFVSFSKGLLEKEIFSSDDKQNLLALLIKLFISANFNLTLPGHNAENSPVYAQFANFIKTIDDYIFFDIINSHGLDMLHPTQVFKIFDNRFKDKQGQPLHFESLKLSDIDDLQVEDETRKTIRRAWFRNVSGHCENIIPYIKDGKTEEYISNIPEKDREPLARQIYANQKFIESLFYKTHEATDENRTLMNNFKNTSFDIVDEMDLPKPTVDKPTNHLISNKIIYKK